MSTRYATKDALRQIGTAFILHEDVLEAYVESMHELLTQTVHLKQYMGWLLPRCYQVALARDMTSLGTHLSTDRYLSDDLQIAVHWAAIVEMPGRICPFDMSNREFEDAFAAHCPDAFARIKQAMGSAWDLPAGGDAADAPHWRLGAYPNDALECPCPVTPEQIQLELDKSAVQRSALWTHVLRRIFFGGTTINDFLGMYTEKSYTPKYQRELFWVARAAVGLVTASKEVSSVGLEAMKHGEHFEDMNVAGCMKLINHGIERPEDRYVHQNVNMVLVPGMEHLFCVSPDGLVTRTDPTVPASYQRMAFEAKCQFARYTCYDTVPDDLYTGQILGEMVGLGTRCAIASFMFYRVVDCALPNNPYKCTNTNLVRATVEFLFMSDDVRAAFLQLLAAVGYYMQVVLNEVLYSMQDSAAGQAAAQSANALRRELEHVIEDIRARLHALIREGHSRKGTRGLQRRYVRFRRWNPHAPQHNMVVDLKDITLDLLHEYFGGDIDLYKQWHNKSYLDFCPKGVPPRAPVKTPHAAADVSARGYYDGWQAVLDAIAIKFPSRVTKQNADGVATSMKQPKKAAAKKPRVASGKKKQENTVPMHKLKL